MVSTLSKDKGEEIKLVTWFLGIYFLFTPFNFFPILPGVSILRLLAFFPLLGLMLHGRYFKVKVDRIFLLLIGYVLFLMLTSLYTFSISQTMQRVISVGTNVVLIILISMIEYNRNEILILKKFLIYSGWIAVGMLLYSSRYIVYGRITAQIGGREEDPNYIVGFLIITFLFHLEKVVKQKKLIHLAAVFIILAVVFMTGSRGGLLAIAGATFFYLFLWIKESRIGLKRIIILLSVLTLLFSIIWGIFYFLPPELVERFTFSEEMVEAGGTGRIPIWNSIIDNFNEAPLFNQLFGKGAGTVSRFAVNFQVAHNIWIESLIEVGVIGTIILMLLYFFVMKKTYRLNESLLLSAFLGYMFMGMTLSLYSYRPIWNLIMMIAMIGNVRSEDQKE